MNWGFQAKPPKLGDKLIVTNPSKSKNPILLIGDDKTKPHKHERKCQWCGGLAFLSEERACCYPRAIEGRKLTKIVIKNETP